MHPILSNRGGPASVQSETRTAGSAIGADTGRSSKENER
jgi:hypothetical protein